MAQSVDLHKTQEEPSMSELIIIDFEGLKQLTAAVAA
jgi:hypothetical protein